MAIYDGDPSVYNVAASLPFREKGHQIFHTTKILARERKITF
jgi:hypothetical protein